MVSPVDTAVPSFDVLVIGSGASGLAAPYAGGPLSSGARPGDRTAGDTATGIAGGNGSRARAAAGGSGQEPARVPLRIDQRRFTARADEIRGVAEPAGHDQVEVHDTSPAAG